MVPIGFVSDHMEVLYDLDTEATAKAAELGLPVRRSATVGADPRFAAAVRDLVLERAAAERGRRRRHGAPWARSARATTSARSGCCPARTPSPPPRAPTAPTPEEPHRDRRPTPRRRNRSA